MLNKQVDFHKELKLRKGNAATRYLSKSNALTTPIGATNLAKLHGLEMDSALHQSRLYDGLAYVRTSVFLSLFTEYGKFIPNDQQKGKEKLESVHQEITEAFKLPESSEDPVEGFLNGANTVQPLSALQKQMEQEGLFTVVPLDFARPALELYAVQSHHEWMKRFGLLIPDGVEKQQEASTRFEEKAAELKLPRRNQHIINRRKEEEEQQDTSPSANDDDVGESSVEDTESTQHEDESGTDSDDGAGYSEESGDDPREDSDDDESEEDPENDES